MTPSTPKIAKPDNSGAGMAKTATNMLFFWLVAGIMAAKDFIDLLLGALEAATTATVVGIPIAVFCAILGGIMTFTVFIIAVIYHLYARRGIMTKLMITSIGMLIGLIPILNGLPEAMLAFFASNFAESIMSAARKVIASTGRAVGGFVSGGS